MPEAKDCQLQNLHSWVRFFHTAGKALQRQSLQHKKPLRDRSLSGFSLVSGLNKKSLSVLSHLKKSYGVICICICFSIFNILVSI